MKLKQSKVFKAGIGYTIGNVMVKGINFLAIPIFSRLLTTEEMGLYTVFAAYEAVLFVFIGMALHSSIRSAKNMSLRVKLMILHHQLWEYIG